jgi:UDP-glucose 4-epimerase
VSKISGDEPPVIYGDGLQTRDFTFVKDVVTANIRAMRSDATGVFNIASGSRITIKELAELAMKLMDKNLSVVFEEPRKGDVKHSLADISKAKAAFGYEPGYRLEKGLEETIKWFS